MLQQHYMHGDLGDMNDVHIKIILMNNTHLKISRNLIDTIVNIT